MIKEVKLMQRHDVLDKILKEQGRAQAWLAKKLGVSKATVNSWAKGKARCPDKYKPQVAKLLGVSVEELFFKEVKSREKW